VCNTPMERLPFLLAVVLAVVVLDLVIWLRHVMLHAVLALWRLHRVYRAVDRSIPPS
jgi:sterol desaturase/sphingolipid hydroxylase (fatty acid hydroxylase superfamily)